ncbi:heat shock protein HtpX [Lactobacillus colini]|uniref:Protease HtpX homolog n=1 Tax=Lactobacillus colini TaxID=1819254 RepID=A0ABS4MCS8_9LACO|nr:zinc metalloprotease HtpX [Lactobacillus colini]MBP2057488.1 heat shock protein HtpX [Lactobacillus colini]
MLYKQIAQNKRKTAILMVVFVIILALVGAGISYLVGVKPTFGISWAIIGSIIYLFIVLLDPASLVMSLNHAQPIHEQDDPELWHVVEDMAMVAQVPMPNIYLINDKSPNAFATGRDPKHSSIAVTSGLRERLDRSELEGVIGHEISHIKNYDIIVSTVGVVLVGVISFLSDIGSRLIWWGIDNDDDDNNSILVTIFKIVSVIFVLLLGPIAAILAQMALSRNREFLADASSVKLTRNPQGLITALEKISNSAPMKQADRSSAGLYIEDPFKTKSFSRLLDTHPPTEERIARLKKM